MSAELQPKFVQKPKFVPALVMPETRPDDSSAALAGRVEIVARNGRRLIVDASLDSIVIARLLAVADERWAAW